MRVYAWFGIYRKFVHGGGGWLWRASCRRTLMRGGVSGLSALRAASAEVCRHFELCLHLVYKHVQLFETATWRPVQRALCARVVLPLLLPAGAERTRLPVCIM